MPLLVLRQEGTGTEGSSTPLSMVRATSFGWIWEADVPPLVRKRGVGGVTALEAVPVEPDPYETVLLAAPGVSLDLPVSSGLGRALGDRWATSNPGSGALVLEVRPSLLGRTARKLLRVLRRILPG